MKKILIYLLVLILVTFAIPIIFTQNFEENKQVASTEYNKENNTENITKDQASSENEEKKSEINNTQNNTEESSLQIQDDSSSYDYKEFNNVRLLHTKTNTIEEVPLDKYLCGVVSAEMPANFEKEAIKAQSIVARTYTVYKIKQNNGKHEGADICDDSNCCQAWISKEERLNKWDENVKEANWNKIVNGVEETKGKIITYEGEPINAFFHSNSGGTTELPVNVWGGTNYPYIQAVETSGEDGYTQYYSEVTLSKEELIQKMKNNYSNFSINFENDNEIQILEYTDGKRVKSIKIGNKNLSRSGSKANF